MKRRKSWPHSQVLVEHPEHLHLIKANLSEKVEKEKDQRLVFGPKAQLTTDQNKDTNQHLAAEDILSSLQHWQAIIFQNGKVIGRSLTLRLYSCEAVDGDLCSQGLGVESFALQLDSWLPAWKAKSDDSSPLYIAVDERFQASSFHIQLLGRTSQGKNFALPFAYRFDGALAHSRLDYFDSYVRRHQQSRQDLLDTSVSSELCVHFDEGLQGFTAIFDVVDQPHWLKSFILRFSVLSASKLDDRVEPRSNRSRTRSEETADSMAPNKPSPVESGTHRRQSHHQPEEQVAVNPARDASSLSQASAMGWLPPSLLPPKADTTSKQKQSKKSMKQRDSQTGGGREKVVRLAGQLQSSAGNGSLSAPSAVDENGEAGRISMGTVEKEEDLDMVAEPVSKAAVSQSLGVLHANGMPLRLANGHAAGHCRMLSEDSDASAGSTERKSLGTSSTSHAPSIIADTAVRWNSMNGADGLVRASLANGHGNAEKNSKHTGCHILLQEPSGVSMNGFIASQHGLNHALHGWQSVQEDASARSLDLTTGEDSDCTMHYSSIDSDRSEGTNVSPELASPPLHGKLEALEPIRLAMPGQPDALEGSKIAATVGHGTRTQQVDTTSPLQLRAGHCGAAAGQASGEGCQPMSGASSAAASTMDSSSHAMPSPLVSPDRVRATAVEAWMGAAAQHLGPSLVRVAVPGDASPSKEPRLLQRPSHESGDPVPSQSPTEMASTIQAGGPLLPVEAPVVAQPAAPSQRTGAPPSLGASVGQPSEPANMPLPNPGGRRHSWSADDSPAYSHDKQAPASSVAPSAEEMRSRSVSGRSSGNGLPSQRRDFPSGMRPPMSGGMAAHSMGYSVAPPAASSMQGSWQMPHMQLPSVNPDFIRELQHRMFLQQQQQQQQRGFMPPSGEHRGPVRTRSLPKLTEQQGQQQAQWAQNGRIAAGTEHRMRQSNGQPLHGAAHDSQQGGTSAKQPTVQHIEALTHQASGPGRSRPDQAVPAPRMLHRHGFSLPTTPVAAHQRAQFPASSAAVMVKLSEGPAVWMGAADAMQLALAQQQQQQQQQSSKPSDVLLLPAVDAKRQRENGETSGTQQPPPPPPRFGASTLQRQGSTQVPLPPPASLWGHQGPPITDIERFMSLSTPIMGSRDYLDLKLSDVWSFYDEASIYGKEVFTMGGGRGPSLAYYVPSLSAMQLFLPVHPDAAHAHAAGQVYRLSDSLTAKHPEWPRFMRPLAELFEGTKPYDRPALRERVEMLAESSADGLTGDRIMDQPLCQLHPASWMCVAWYPIYRIPDAPLTAKFLTYHSFSPVPTGATHYGARGLEAGHPVQHADSLLCLPTVGLKLCHLASEEWLDPVPAGPSLTSAGIGRASSSCSSSGDNWSVSTDEEQAERERAFAMKAAAVGSWDGPYARRARLKMLSEGADRLSQREGLIAPSAVSKGRHDDYTFFVTRCEDDPLRL